MHSCRYDSGRMAFARSALLVLVAVAAFTAVSAQNATAPAPAAAAPATAATKYNATLVGHALIPANTFQAPPADAPAQLNVSCKYCSGTNGNRRIDTLGAFVGTDGNGTVVRPTGLSYPFVGQPLQGLSGIKTLGNGTYLHLQDNGFGNKPNSPDLILQAYVTQPNFGAGNVTLLKTIFLNDPDKKVPFLIKNEYTSKRYLTGSDFDIESIQPVGTSYWFGDEFGPYLLEVNAADGKVLNFYDTVVPGLGAVRSPDNDKLILPNPDASLPVYELKHSKGFEGMAQSPDGRYLYPLLEGPLWNYTAKTYEKTPAGKEFLRIMQFDLSIRNFTSTTYKYPLETNGNAIGDFNMVDATRGMIIERDNGAGDRANACTPGTTTTNCFDTPALLKRIYMINLNNTDADGFLVKNSYIDLLDIADPNAVSRVPLVGGRFTFPFVTIESVDVSNATAGQIIVCNDNNLPFSAGRVPNQVDNNEFIILSVPEFLRSNAGGSVISS
ncbi:hypothetical protein KFL_000380225 [Klebsormidium nitens]|uniref:Phytase-like domain-containing protein n=1 Tax=Klebsormidium nitens TaxID=105231 RepID=A0A1Y1HRK2_KLENI|nr:hypothetical protein KFL_000380225 [Klebsormidium nitens]|eukprot:GAQ79789.1 hypothetical protein KFL_000380225 [Klebsormidium nitens]